MALTRIGGSSVAATSVTIPSHQAGDLLVIWAYKDGATTVPTKPSAGGTVPTWNTIDGPTGANLNAAICCWALAAGTTDTSGTWTGATGLSVEVWRGQKVVSPIGGHAQGGSSASNGALLLVPAITLTDSSGASTALGFAGWRTVTAWSAAPSGYTQRSQVATECEALTEDLTLTANTYNVSGTASGNGGYRTEQIEILILPAGAAARSETLTITAAGVRTALGAATRSETLTITAAGVRKAGGAAARSETITFAAAGVRTAVGAAARPETLAITSAGVRTAHSAANEPLSIIVTATGVRTAFDSVGESLSLIFTAAGDVTTPSITGAVHFGLALTMTSTGIRSAHSSAALALVYTPGVTGRLTAVGAARLSEALTITTSGVGSHFASSTLPFVLTTITDGFVTPLAYAAATGGSVTFGEESVDLEQNRSGRIEEMALGGFAR